MPKLLLIAETDGAKLQASTFPALSYAQAWAAATGATFDILVAGGPEIASEAEALRGYGAAKALVLAGDVFAHATADSFAAAVVQIVKQIGADSVAAPSATFGRDVLPRIATILDAPMVSDVLSVEKADGRLTFKRPMYAGNVIATVQIDGDAGVFSVRGTAFGKPTPSGAQSPVENVTIDVAALPTATTWISLDSPEQKRPDVTNARVVVSGGRPLKDAETYERIIGGLADKLGGATGATRAAVDSGIAPNEAQVGQTGKIVAPELYIAAGVSGSVQHMAGMKESKVIVAINTDPEAPIFDIADYGLVQDLYIALPEMQAKA